MSRRLLTVDVGNTATSFGFFSLSGSGRYPSPPRIVTVSTKSLLTAAPLRLGLEKNVHGIIVSSVVPAVNKKLSLKVKKKFGAVPYFVSASTPSRVKIRYRDPSEVGADRIVNARAAVELAAGASVVIDFGTATTFDCVTAKKEYLGGVIAPGPVISAEALYQRTAKLPLVVLDKPARILGRNTLESIQAGLYHGYRGLVKEIISQLKKVMGARTKVFTTGGQAGWILGGLSGIDRHVPTLTLDGLYLLWRDLKSEA